MKRLARALILLTTVAACGRSWIYDDTPAPTALPCRLELKPTALSYGQVGLGEAVTSRLLLWNGGGTTCQISQVALGPGTNADFELPAAQPTQLSIEPGEDASLDVDFDAASELPPAVHTGTLVFQSSDPKNADVTVPLSATIHTVCALQVTPAAIDYGQVAIGSVATRSATLTDVGSAPCDVSAIQIGSASDPEFTLGSGQSTTLALQPGASAAIPVTFAATDRALPHRKQGSLTLQTGDPLSPSATVALTAGVDTGCELVISPAAVDFGNVSLNVSVTNQVTLTNQGTAACDVSNLAMARGGDIDFSLPRQPLAFSVAVGASASIAVTFDAANPPPDQRNGTLTFLTGDAANPTAAVPLSGFIETNCTSAGLLIYVVDSNTTLSTFNPETLTFHDLGQLDCPGAGKASPFSMAMDQNAIAWVLYLDQTGGAVLPPPGHIFRVDPATLICTATSFVPGQQGMSEFGMGFAFDPASATDTLFIAGGPSVDNAENQLATLSFPSLTVSVVTPLTNGSPELTGTGDDQLWGFFPSEGAPGGGETTPTMVQLDQRTGAVLQTLDLPQITGEPAAWAVGFFGGAFWIFLDRQGGGGGFGQGNSTNIYEVQRDGGTLTTAIANTNRTIVGAGVSTCAPLQ